MILDESVLPTQWVRGSPCAGVGIEPHPREAPIAGRDSIATDGCVVLGYMPKCIYVRMRGSTAVHLPPRADFDVTDVLAIRPKGHSWKFTPSTHKKPVYVTRTQITLLPQKQGTLHGVQGKTADPGFVVHWRYPKRLPKEGVCLAHYVSLSRPRSVGQMLSHGLPSREVIEGGPPEAWLAELDTLFGDKTEKTKRELAKARAALGWPARKG